MTRPYELTALRRPLRSRGLSPALPKSQNSIEYQEETGPERPKARSTVRWFLEWLFLWRADRCMRAGIRWRERKDRLWRRDG